MLPLVVFAAGMSHSALRRPTLRPTPQGAALHHPRAAAVRASAADKGKERDERASAADEGEALCRQVAVEVAQVRAAEQAVCLEAWQSATANSSDTGDFQAGVLGIVSLQLGWTALLVTAACGTGLEHDLILPWHQPISLAGSLLETDPGWEGVGWDAVFSGVPAFVQLWALGCFASTVALEAMELDRFEPTKYLWLGASTLAVSWPVAVFCSCCAADQAQIHQAAALTAVEVLVVVGAHLLTAKHVDYERRGVDPLVRAEMTHWALDCAASIEYSVCALAVSWVVLEFELFGELGKTLGIVVHDAVIASFSITGGSFVWLLLVQQALTRSPMESFKKGDAGWPVRSLKNDYASSALRIYTVIGLIWFWLSNSYWYVL